MKKIFLITGLISACFFNAQIKFEKGYIIKNSGGKSEVLIKNIDWKDNPTDFEYKTDETSPIKKESIKNIQEFAIYNGNKYVRRTVMIDMSSDELNKMSDTAEPNFEQKTLFLKYIVEGNADLLYYGNGDIKRYFYADNKDQTVQLIYKPYYLNTSEISYNKDYKNQILKYLNCNNSKPDVANLNYNSKSLKNIFITYNKCINNEAFDYTEKNEKRDLFNFNIRPGINFSSFEMTNSATNNYTTDFGSKVTFRLGLEFEFILPFNKNKWALFIEPNYQYFKAEKSVKDLYYDKVLDRVVDYKTIQIPIGLRHYFFLNDKSKIFINLAYGVNLQLNSQIKTGNYNDELKVNSGNSIIMGAGFKYKDKFGIEMRYSNESLLRDYTYWNSDYKTISLILGYTLF